jgi:hypothetical protein
LDGQPVMAMFRRSPKSTPPLRRQQEELARRELELRDRIEELERRIVGAPRILEEAAQRQREELRMRAEAGSSRLDVSIALQDKRYSDDDQKRRRPRSLRKERREGRMVFLLLLAALATAVIWLMNHLHF